VHSYYQKKNILASPVSTIWGYLCGGYLTLKTSTAPLASSATGSQRFDKTRPQIVLPG